MGKGGQINGHVIDVSTGKPIVLGETEKMSIGASDDPGHFYAGMNNATIQSDGTFTLLLPVGQNYLGMYFGPNWRGVNTDALLQKGINVAEGQTQDLEIRVKPSHGMAANRPSRVSNGGRCTMTGPLKCGRQLQVYKDRSLQSGRIPQRRHREVGVGLAAQKRVEQSRRQAANNGIVARNELPDLDSLLAVHRSVFVARAATELAVPPANDACYPGYRTGFQSLLFARQHRIDSYISTALENSA